jgi:hypothetical protein
MIKKIFTARELMDELREIDVRLYENVLDAITDYYDKQRVVFDDKYYTWEEDEEGRMSVVLYAGE